LRLKAAKEALEMVNTLTPDKYLKLLDKAYRNHKDSLNKSADKGVDLHACLENYILDCMAGKVKPFPEYNARIMPFIEWSVRNVKKFLWAEACCYSEKLWVGGQCDFGALLNDGSLAVGDHKSHKDAYISDYLQDGGYSLLIEENGLFDANGNKIGGPFKADKLIVVPFGAEIVEPQIANRPVADYQEGFKNALSLYRLMGLDEKGRK
jgi:hypothetical protein